MALGTPYFDSPTTFASAGTSAVPYPTGTVPAANDLLILTISLFVSGTVTTPAGWTLIDGFSNSANTLAPTIYAFWKFAAGGESGTVTVTHTTGKSEAQIAGQSGADQTTPIDVSPVHFTSGSVDDSTGGTANCVITGLTIATAGATVYTVSADNAAAHTATPPAGFTEIADGSGANVNLHVSYKLNVSTGATGSQTVVFSGSGKHVGFLIAVRPSLATVDVTRSRTRAVSSGIGLGISGTRSRTRAAAAAISGVAPGSGSDVGGLASTQLEVLLNGSWVDITAYARLSGDAIERGVGRGSEVDDSQPGYLTFTLDNLDGRFYPDSPTIRTSPGVTAPNPYYPYFVEDIQVRWHVNDGTSRLRFLGWITDLTPSWGGVMAADSTVTVTATDSLGRQSRGLLRSMIVQTQLASSNLLSCYPIGEIAGSPVAADVSGAVMPPLKVRAYGNGPGLSFGNPGPGIEGDLAATFGPKNASGYGKFLISVGGAKGALLGLGYTVEAWFRLGIAANGQYDIVGVASGDRTYSLSVQTSGTGGVAAGNTLVCSQTAPGSSVVSIASPAVGDGGWHHVAISLDTGGTLIAYYLDGVLWSSDFPISTGDYRDLYVGGVIPNGPLILDGSVAAVACYNRPLNSTEVLAHAAAGLTTSVSTIAQQATAVAGFSGTSIAQESGFGPQNAVPFKTAGLTPLDALLTVIRSEGGLVYDNGSGSYCRARSALKSSTVGITLDTEADLQGPPVLSRSTLAKVATVTATSSAGDQTVTDPTALALLGAGASVTLDTSLADAVEVYSIASNRISQGLNRKTRLSQVVCDLNLSKNNLYAAMLTLQPGDRVRLSNLPSEFMGATYTDGYVLGWVERLGWDDGYTFVLDLIAADAPKELGFDTFRFASDGTSTGGTMTATGTTMVITSPGATWSVNAGDYPMDIDYNGERITLTSAPGVGPSPQSFTGVTRGVAPTVARAHTAGEPVEVFDVIRFAF